MCELGLQNVATPALIWRPRRNRNLLTLFLPSLNVYAMYILSSICKKFFFFSQYVFNIISSGVAQNNLQFKFLRTNQELWLGIFPPPPKTHTRVQMIVLFSPLPSAILSPGIAVILTHAPPPQSCCSLVPGRAKWKVPHIANRTVTYWHVARYICLCDGTDEHQWASRKCCIIAIKGEEVFLHCWELLETIPCFASATSEFLSSAGWAEKRKAIVPTSFAQAGFSVALIPSL